MFLLLINTVDAGLLRNLKPTCANVRCANPCLDNPCGNPDHCIICDTYEAGVCTGGCKAAGEVCPRGSYKCENGSTTTTTTTTTTAPASGTDGETGGGCIEDELPCTGGCGDCCSRTSTNLGRGEKMCGVATETETAASTGCQSDTDCSKDGSMWCMYTNDPCGSGGGTCGEPSTEPCVALYLPVCGCNGQQYSNSCFAGLHGLGPQDYSECGSGGEPI